MEPNLPTPTKKITKPQKVCGYGRCGNKTTGTYCKEHEYLASKWDSGLHPWYQKKIWRGNPNVELGKRGGLRERQLMKEPLCRHCKDKGIIKEAEVADHINEWKSGMTEAEQWELFVDFDNLQSLCHSCHNQKTARNNK